MLINAEAPFLTRNIVDSLGDINSIVKIPTFTKACGY